jgi:hypothetical protein
MCKDIAVPTTLAFHKNKLRKEREIVEGEMYEGECYSNSINKIKYKALPFVLSVSCVEEKAIFLF